MTESIAREVVGEVKYFNPHKRWGLLHVAGLEEPVWFHMGDSRTVGIGRRDRVSIQHIEVKRTPVRGDRIIVDTVLAKKEGDSFPKAYGWYFPDEYSLVEAKIQEVLSRVSYWGEPWFVVFLTPRLERIGDYEFTLFPATQPKEDWGQGFLLRKYGNLMLYQDKNGRTWTEQSLFVRGDGTVGIQLPSLGYDTVQVKGIIPEGNPGFWYWDGKTWEHKYLAYIKVSTLIIKGVRYPAYFKAMGFVNCKSEILKAPVRRKHAPWFYQAEVDAFDDEFMRRIGISFDAPLDEPIEDSGPLDWLENLSPSSLESESAAEPDEVKPLRTLEIEYELDFEMLEHQEAFWLLKDYCTGGLPNRISVAKTREAAEREFVVESGRLVFKDGAICNVKFYPGGWTLGRGKREGNLIGYNDLMLTFKGRIFLKHAADLLEDFSPDELETLLGIRSVQSWYELPRSPGFLLFAESKDIRDPDSKVVVHLLCPHHQNRQDALQSITVTDDIFGMAKALNTTWQGHCEICGDIKGLPDTMLDRVSLLRRLMPHEYTAGLTAVLDPVGCKDWLNAITLQLAGTYKSALSYAYISSVSNPVQGIYTIEEGGYCVFYPAPIKVVKVAGVPGYYDTSYDLYDKNHHLLGCIDKDCGLSSVFNVVESFWFGIEDLLNSGMWDEVKSRLS
jgi:hypothetical protein